MNSLSSLIKQSPLVAFFLLALILPWIGDPLSDWIYNGTILSIVFALPVACLVASPLIAALVVTGVTEGKAGVKRLLGQFTRWRVGLRWYAVALLLPPAIYLGAIYVNGLLGAPVPGVAQLGTWSTLLMTFALRLVNPFDGPVMEELGWRGFAQPRLQQRFSPLVANLILGAIVVLWHVRYLPGGDYAWIYAPATLAFTLIAAWLYNRTGGSLLLALLLHVTDGLIRPQELGLVGAAATRMMWLPVMVYVAVATGLLMINWRWWTGREENRAVRHQTALESAASN